MNAKQKKIVKIVGISLGTALLIGGSVAILVHLKKEKEFSDEPFENLDNQNVKTSYQSSSTSNNSNPYTATEIERMQTWLTQTAILHSNGIIIEAIRTTGGIDGQMGEGFNTALVEAIKRGYVKSLTDLYNKIN